MENEIPQKEQTGGLKLMTVFIIVLTLHVIVIGAITIYHSFPRGENKDTASVTKSDSTDAPKSGDDSAATSTSTTVAGDDQSDAKANSAQPGEASKSTDLTDPEATAANKPAVAPTAPETVNQNTIVDSKGTPNTASAPVTTPAPVADSAPAPIADQPVVETTPAVATGTEVISYTVKSGDTLSRIARHNGTTIAELKRDNGLKSSALKIGQVLKIKSGSASATSVATAAPVTATPVATAAPVAVPTMAATASTGTITYKVSSGDTLTKIARKFRTTAASIIAVNKIVDANKLRVGTSLIIPQKGAKSSVSENAAPIAPMKTASLSPELVMNK